MNETKNKTTTSWIFCYLLGDFKCINHATTDTCEDVCVTLCKELGIGPVYRPLFGLRINGSTNWLPGCRTLKSDVSYDFRLRFKIPKLSNLKSGDLRAYKYFYFQIRNDVLNSKITELTKASYSDQVLGLCITDMYRDMVENNRTAQDLIQNYRQYIPRELARRHWWFVKRIINKHMQKITNRDHDADYVRGVYLESLAEIAPNFMTEEFTATAEYPKEDNMKEGTCPVTIQIAPFHSEQPGLRAFYHHKNMWKHIAKIDDIFAIILGETEVKIEMKEDPAGYRVIIINDQHRESFVSCLVGYYRLMVKWNVDLCDTLTTPTLVKLRSLKCFGPVGGVFAYNRIEEKRNDSQVVFLVRQCDKFDDIYYIDYAIKDQQTQTSSMTYDKNQWILYPHLPPFDKLLTLAKHLTDNPDKMLRISPSDYDKPSLLLLCLPEEAMKPNIGTFLRFSEQQRIKPCIISASNELVLFGNEQHDDESGCFTRVRGEWRLPSDKAIEVTLKILKVDKIEKHLSHFMCLADLWCSLDSSEIVRLHGITLRNPIAMVMEATNLGPLDEFLRFHTAAQVDFVCLIDAAHSLVRALHYLQEYRIIHGRIRCSTLQVSSYDGKSALVVKLGDPGFARRLTNKDIPWIPVEHFDNLQDATKDLKADIWAVATTLWEIFSRGTKIELSSPKQFFKEGHRLAPPKQLAGTNQALCMIYKIMYDGWHVQPEKRFSPQDVFARLFNARQIFSRPYLEIDPEEDHPCESFKMQDLNGAVNENVDADEVEQSLSNQDESEEESQFSGGSSSTAINDAQNLDSSLCTTLATFDYAKASSYIENIPQALEWNKGFVVFKKKIGEGCYGTVYLGDLHDKEKDRMIKAAVKTLNNEPSPSSMLDFHREAKIMERLDHPNIVKIYHFVEEPRVVIVMEFIEHGSFANYLASNAPNITTQNLLKFAEDIANGMVYLQSQEIIHRDLAARNILVASERCVKLSDFGLAQKADTDGYYLMKTTRCIPIKWYAPESLRYQKFSFQSDVWSFGITLYEMFTFGQSPILEPDQLSTEKLIKRLDDGERLKKPKACSDQIYDELMFPCWNAIAKSRPTFSELLMVIKSLIDNNGEFVD